MNITHITNDGKITNTNIEGILEMLKSQQEFTKESEKESKQENIDSVNINYEPVIAPEYDGSSEYVYIVCCPYCGNNDPKYNNTIEVVVKYASSGWDVKCKACTPPVGYSEIWTYSPPGINPFGNTTPSNYKKINKSWAINNS